MNRNVKFEIENFSTIYNMQAKGQSFQTVPDMLRAMGGDTFVQETQVRIHTFPIKQLLLLVNYNLVIKT